MSTHAVALLELLPKANKGEPLFGPTSSPLDGLVRKGRDRSMIEELTFHDTRHEAITRLAKKLNVLELARMIWAPWWSCVADLLQ